MSAICPNKRPLTGPDDFPKAGRYLASGWVVMNRAARAVVGDGASMYTVQALWTATTFNIPVVYAICNNRAYRILKVNMDIYLKRMLNNDDRVSEYTGMDFANPLDLSSIAQGMGVASEKITDPSQIGPAARRMFESGKPGLLDISIDGSL